MRFGKESYFTTCLVFCLPKQSNYFAVRTIFLNCCNNKSIPLCLSYSASKVSKAGTSASCRCMSSDAAPYLSHTAEKVVVTLCCMPPACRNLISSLSPKHSCPNAVTMLPSRHKLLPSATHCQQSTYQHAACFTFASSHLHPKDDRALLGNFQSRKCVFVSKQQMWHKEADGVLSVVIGINWLRITVTLCNNVYVNYVTCCSSKVKRRKCEKPKVDCQ
jgi:hypothetical protein